LAGVWVNHGSIVRLQPLVSANFVCWRTFDHCVSCWRNSFSHDPPR